MISQNNYILNLKPKGKREKKTLTDTYVTRLARVKLVLDGYRNNYQRQTINNLKEVT